jgi:hypothetical protein
MYEAKVYAVAPVQNEPHVTLSATILHHSNIKAKETGTTTAHLISLLEDYHFLVLVS